MTLNLNLLYADSKSKSWRDANQADIIRAFETFDWADEVKKAEVFNKCSPTLSVESDAQDCLMWLSAIESETGGIEFISECNFPGAGDAPLGTQSFGQTEAKEALLLFVTESYEQLRELYEKFPDPSIAFGKLSDEHEPPGEKTSWLVRLCEPVGMYYADKQLKKQGRYLIKQMLYVLLPMILGFVFLVLGPYLGFGPVRILGTICFFVSAAGVSFIIIQCLRIGVIVNRFGIYERKKSPFSFWFGIVGLSCLSAALFFLAVMLLFFTKSPN